MRSFQKLVSVFVVVLLNTTVVSSFALGASPLETYMRGYNEMGKTSAAWSAYQSAMINAQANLIKANAEMVTAVANARQTNAKTLSTLEQVRSLRLANNLKWTKDFYEKRTVRETHLSLNTRERPSRDDVIRYNKASVPERPTIQQLDSDRGKIIWPPVLKKDQFSEQRMELDDLFAQRKYIDLSDVDAHNEISQQARKLTKQMSVNLHSLIRKMPSDEYLAARRFIDSLAYETRFPNGIEGLANN